MTEKPSQEFLEAMAEKQQELVNEALTNVLKASMQFPDEISEAISAVITIPILLHINLTIGFVVSKASNAETASTRNSFYLTETNEIAEKLIKRFRSMDNIRERVLDDLDDASIH